METSGEQLVTNRTAQPFPKRENKCTELSKFAPKRAVFRKIRSFGPKYAVSRRDTQFHARICSFCLRYAVFHQDRRFAQRERFCGCHPSYELTKNRMIIFRFAKGLPRK